MINEGAKILEEGKAIRASDIDIVWINGYGWPVYRGGPMFYGDTIGLDKVLGQDEGIRGARWATTSSRRRCSRKWSPKRSSFRIFEPRHQL